MTEEDALLAAVLAELERIARAWDDAAGDIGGDEAFVYNLGSDFRDRVRELIAKVRGGAG
jgi:hypothetical protein